MADPDRPHVLSLDYVTIWERVSGNDGVARVDDGRIRLSADELNPSFIYVNTELMLRPGKRKSPRKFRVKRGDSVSRKEHARDATQNDSAGKAAKALIGGVEVIHGFARAFGLWHNADDHGIVTDGFQ